MEEVKKLLEQAYEKAFENGVDIKQVSFDGAKLWNGTLQNYDLLEVALDIDSKII